MIGKYFLDNCLNSTTIDKPWSHQIINDTLPQEDFDTLRKECENLDIPNDRLVAIYPKDFNDYNISFHDQIQDISKNILNNAKELCEKYPAHRWFNDLAVNAHISITPPLPYKFYIHQEGLEKIWSSVTYITPEKNVGTKMYTAQKEDTFVKEAEWKPNSTFIFCGQQGKTWHSYESDQTEQRITLNLFLMKENKHCFYKG
jgi:hypothetical protein|tara:strand:+ start:195 stop:797 length:603 start_codon:yes stop_codon:yes gene_type:complete